MGMKAIICEICGSNDLVKQNGMFVCQHCGTKYSVEDAKQLFGTVRIDKTEETKKLMVLARRAREDANSENAERYYDMVLQEDPNNWEAAFFQVYYRAMQCKIIDISNAAYSVANSINSTLKLISKTLDEADEDSAFDTVIAYSCQIASMLSDAAISHYNQYSSLDGAINECSERVVAAYSIYKELEASLAVYCPPKVIKLRKRQNSFIRRNIEYFNATFAGGETKRLTNAIKEEDSSYTPPSWSQNGCYVATAVYGSYDCPQVWTLRRYRDSTLASTWYGRTFIRTYYAISPTLVRWFGQSAWFKKMWKGKLDQMVNNLKAHGVEDTPYVDSEW